MERWLEFMQNHPFLFGTLGVLLVVFFALENRRSGRKISPQSLGTLVNAHQAVVIDLRDSKDFRAGHISGSRNVPYSQLDRHLEELRALTTPVVLVCNLGQVAGAAAQKIGTAQVCRLDGGITNWRASGLPLVKASA